MASGEFLAIIGALFVIIGLLFLVVGPFVLGWFFYKRYGATSVKTMTKFVLSIVLLVSVISALVLAIMLAAFHYLPPYEHYHEITEPSLYVFSLYFLCVLILALGAVGGTDTTKSYFSISLLASGISALLLMIYLVTLSYNSIATAFFVTVLFYFPFAFISALAGAYPAYRGKTQNVPATSIPKQSKTVLAVLTFILETIPYFAVLVALSYLALISSMFDHSERMSLFTFYQYLLSFILCFPITFALLGASPLNMLLEFVYLYFLAWFLPKKIIIKRVLVLAVIFLIIGYYVWETERPLGGEYKKKTEGWWKLQPISASITYKAADKSFEATFQNTANRLIRVKEISIKETLSGQLCGPVLIKGVPYTDASGAAITPSPEVSVNASDGLEITTVCSDIDKPEGDLFDMLITINYTSVIGGVTTHSSETGHIRGPAEA
jgi:hypothetical protein